jgi:hypothetical protein
MEGLFSGQLAQLAMASLAVKALLSGLKFVFPQVGTPATFTPIQLRVAAIVLGVFLGLAMQVSPLTLPAGAHIIYVYGNHVLGGLLVGLGALGAHEGVDILKKPA